MGFRGRGGSGFRGRGPSGRGGGRGGSRGGNAGRGAPRSPRGHNDPALRGRPHSPAGQQNGWKRPLQQGGPTGARGGFQAQNGPAHAQVASRKTGFLPAGAVDTDLKDVAELLCNFDHRNVRWWDVEAQLLNKNDANKKDQKDKKSEAQAQKPVALPAGHNEDWAKRGERVLAAAQAMYEARRGKNMDQDMRWTEKVVTQGTLSDKIAAMTLLVQEAPLFRLHTLDLLLSLAGKGDRRCTQMAVEAIKDLMLHNLLPEGKLRTMGGHDAALLPRDDLTRRDALLALWYYESELKKRFGQLLARLEKGSFDTVENFKRVCMSIMAELLEGKAEGEATLLAALVNKLGDVDKKVAPHASHLLRRVLSHHPVMKVVMAREVQQFLHRPNLQPRALYNGITFLDQLILKRGDHELSMQLIKTYFQLFDVALKAGDLGTKMLSALLTGVNRAYPYLEDKDKDASEGPLRQHLEDLFRTVHGESFKTSVQALMLLQQMVGGQSQTPKHQGTQAEASGLEARFYRAVYDKLRAPELLSTSTPVLFLNLVYKAMKKDREEARVQAFAKRLLSVVLHGSSALCAAAVFLLSEVLKTHKCLLQATVAPAAADQDPDAFDMYKREPLFALKPQDKDDDQPAKRRTVAHLWELALLRSHFHPSVCHFADSLMGPEHVVGYAGDPLVDFSNKAFLDRFAFKNPKIKTGDHDAKGAGGLSKAAAAEVLSAQLGPVMDSREFLASAPGSVGRDKLFFYKFFKEKAQRDLRAGTHKKKGGGEDESDDDQGDSDDSDEMEESEEDSEDEGESDDGRPTRKARAASDEDEEDEDTDSGSDASSEDEEAEDADEDEIDAFADKLALQLMSKDGKLDYDDEDPDMDDWDPPADSEDEDDEGESDEEGKEGEEEGSDGLEGLEGVVDDEDDDEDDDDEDGEEDGDAFLDDMSDGSDAPSFMDDGREEEEEEEEVSKKGKKSKQEVLGKRKKDGDSGGLFASADDYEALLEAKMKEDEQMQDQREAQKTHKLVGGNKTAPKKQQPESKRPRVDDPGDKQHKKGTSKKQATKQQQGKHRQK